VVYKILSRDILGLLVCCSRRATLCFQVAAEIAAPLSQAKKVTMVSMGKGDVGAAKLTGEVLDIMEKLPKVVETMTGVNITKVSGRVVANIQ
jgi:hypothetical protein